MMHGWEVKNYEMGKWHKFCRAVIQNFDTCKHYKRLCKTGEFCFAESTCPVKQTAKEAPNELHRKCINLKVIAKIGDH